MIYMFAVLLLLFGFGGFFYMLSMAFQTAVLFFGWQVGLFANFLVYCMIACLSLRFTVDIIERFGAFLKAWIKVFGKEK